MSRYAEEEARNDSLRAKLDRLFELVTERLIEQLEKPTCKHFWVALAIRWAAHNGIKLGAGKRAALSAMASLRSSVDQMAALSADFGAVKKEPKQ